MARKKGKGKPVYPENKPSKVDGQKAGKGRTNNPNPKRGNTSRKK